MVNGLLTGALRAHFPSNAGHFSPAKPAYQERVQVTGTRLLNTGGAQSMTNPYAPPTAVVQDVSDPQAQAVPADRGTRLGAAVLDAIIFVAMVYVPLLFGTFLGAVASRATDDRNIGMTMIAVGMAVLPLGGVIVWTAFTIKYLRRNGQSIAKKLLGIKAVRTDGSPASLARLFWLRNVVNWIISFVPFYGLLDSLFIFGESRQCLHDKLADTIVVKA